MKNFKEQCTTMEQSRELIKLGFNQDTASARYCRYSKDYDYWDLNVSMHNVAYFSSIPCWTCTDMIEIINNNYDPYFASCFSPNVLLGEDCYDDETGYVTHAEPVIGFESDSLRDNLFDCLIWLKNKYGNN